VLPQGREKSSIEIQTVCSDAQLRVIVRRFASPRNDFVESPPEVLAAFPVRSDAEEREEWAPEAEMIPATR
jgi:hypothetical protein